MFSKEINMSDLTIKITGEEDISIFYYSGNAEIVGAKGVFNHPIWEKQEEYTFSYIVIKDSDNSLVDYNIINDNTDIAFITLKLPNSLAMSKKETITVELIPGVGTTRILDLKAPLYQSDIFTFEWKKVVDK